MAIAPWAPKGAVAGALAEKAPLNGHGVSLVLTRTSHKQMVSGPVVGIWEWELRKGAAKVAGKYTGDKLLAETAGFGVLASIDGEQAKLVPWLAKPWTEDQAMEFAEKEHARRNLPKANGTGYHVENGVLFAAFFAKPRTVRMAIGLHSRRVLSVAIESDDPASFSGP